MKDKILLEVYLPVVGRSFDVRIPRQLKVARVTSMLVEFLKKQDEEYIPTAESVLCRLDSGRAIDPNAFVEDGGLCSGARVMLI